jgi:hypothetical protein
MKQISIINKVLVVELTFKTSRVSKRCRNGTSKSIRVKENGCEANENGLDCGRGVCRKEKQERKCYNNRYSNMKQISIINKVLVVELTIKTGQSSNKCWNGTS